MADPIDNSSDEDTSEVAQTPDDDFLHEIFHDDDEVGQVNAFPLPDVDTGSEPDTDPEGDSDIDAGPFSGLSQQDEEAVQSNVPFVLEPQDQDADSGDPAIDTNGDRGDPVLDTNGAQLGYTVHIEKFTLGRAGAPIDKRDLPTNQRYQRAFGNADNIYAPFTSKLDWEIARWGKTRGGSSTAFNELLGIDGVSAA